MVGQGTTLGKSGLTGFTGARSWTGGEEVFSPSSKIGHKNKLKIGNC
jgi:hypothetical protein